MHLLNAWIIVALWGGNVKRKRGEIRKKTVDSGCVAWYVDCIKRTNTVRTVKKGGKVMAFSLVFLLGGILLLTAVALIAIYLSK